MYERRIFHILGVPIDAVHMSRAVEAVLAMARDVTPHSVFVRDVASLMVAVDEKRMFNLHCQADLVVPDGMPLVLLGRIRGYGSTISRVSGADLLDEVCATSLVQGETHYFYGGKPGISTLVAEKLAAKYPDLRVVGTFSPPMRDIGPDFEPDAECEAEIEHIKACNPDVIWIGMSSPKQEYWISKAAPRIGRGVFLGIGAAFDFHAGAFQRAPLWMQRSGLEWLHRLISEPRRLWKRYLLSAPRFVVKSVKEEIMRALRAGRGA